MSRLGLSCLLVLSLTSVASARRLVASPFATPAAPMPVHADIDVELRADVPLGPTRGVVRDALLKARAKNLASFRAYWKGGSYPSNVYSSKLLNVWRDEAGKFCAAATIMVKSGNEALAIKLAEDNNFIKLADVEQGPVMDWILTSGFTQAELVQIQKPFGPVVTRPIAEPTRPLLVNARLRRAETARLLAKYKQVDKQLAAKQKQSLEHAVDRLMANPTLAWSFVHAAV